MLKVAIRNGIHDALRDDFGIAAWYDWQNLLGKRERRQVAEGKTRTRKARKPVTSGRAVAPLNVGNRTSRLRGPYGPTI